MFKVRTLFFLIASLIALAASGFPAWATSEILVLSSPTQSRSSALFEVDVTTGEVSLLAEIDEVQDPRDLALLPGGQILILDVESASGTIPSGTTPASSAQLLIWDPDTGEAEVLATLPQSSNPTGLTLLGPDRAVVCDPSNPFPPDPNAVATLGGVLFDVNLVTGDYSILLQSPRLTAPLDVSALGGLIAVADEGSNVYMNPLPQGGVFSLTLENGSLQQFTEVGEMVRPRRLDSSSEGIVVLDHLNLHIIEHESAASKRVFGPVPAADITDLAWGNNGEVFVLDTKSVGTLYAIDSNLQATEVAKSPLLSRGIALVGVPTTSRRVGVLENHVAQGVNKPVPVEISMSDVSNLGALRIELQYDPAMATPGTPVLTPYAEQFTHIFDKQPGQLVWQFFDVEGDGVDDSDLSPFEPVALVRVPFELNGNLPNNARVWLRLHPTNTEAFDVDVAPLPLETVNGYISVVRGLHGDINADGRVNSGDAVLALQHGTRRNLSPVEQARGDVNEDERINTGDALLILRTATGIREETSF